MANEKRIPKRSEVPVEETWRLEDLYETPEKWEEEAASLAALPAEISAFAGHLADDAATLLNWFRKNDEISMKLNRFFGYAMKMADTDLGNNAHQARKGKAMGIMVAIESAAAFADPELMAISEEKLEAFYAAEPALEQYRRAIEEILRHRAHVLSPAEEKLLAAAGEMAEGPSNIGGIFRNTDLKFPDVIDKDGNAHQVTQGSFIPYMESEDRDLRRRVFESFYHTWASHESLSATILDAHIKQLSFFARARGYNSNLEASLDRTNVPTSVYHNLIDTVHKHLPTMHRYMALRKKLLGVDELHMYDLYNTIVADADEVVPYPQAQAAVLEAVKPLGEDYVNVVKEAFANRWIDVRENEGKRSGAYSSGGQWPHPYVLLNHKDTLDSQFTLAHEMGHAMHSYLSMHNQPETYAHYVIFVAEVASTCNEVLMMQNLLSKTTDRTRRAYLINHFLEQFRTTLYRQTMFAEFELKINEISEAGETLTAARLNEVYHELNRQYYGDGMVVDTEIGSEWARIPHFFYNYYVFQYATGFSAAVALGRKIYNEGGASVEDYLKFLSSGSSSDPISLLKIAGVDMATPAPVDAALELFDELITEMEELMS